MVTTRCPLALALALLLVSSGAASATSDFVTFESGPVRPLALSADGSRLFAANTPGNQLEIFSVGGAGELARTATVPVGLEPVAVAVRSSSEVWVVNHLSDSVSVVDVASAPPRVKRTLLVGDEPRDIVFAGPGGNRAFVTTAHRGQNIGFDPQLTTSGVGRADVWVFDATNLGASLGGTPLTVVTLFGDTPRALAATPDGSTVYAAVFHSGNQTTAVTEAAVCNRSTPTVPAGPCTFNGLSMPGGLPAPLVNIDNVPGPETGLIVKFNPSNSRWEDPLSRNWTPAVRFNLPDKDVFAIDAMAPTPVESASFSGVGTVLFNMVVHPTNGKVYVTNTEARNEVRFEGAGGLGITTVRGHLAESRITVIDGASVLPRHLNKHINYTVIPAPTSVKDASLATPTQAVLSADGSTMYVAAFGSNQIGVFNTAEIDADSFTPSASSHIAIPGGLPAGLALHEGHARLYVLSRFDNSISAVDLGTGTEAQRVALLDPEPFSVVSGRRFLYDAQVTSSNGEASCSSCHIFGDNDDLAWDLGDPGAAVLVNFNPFVPGLGPFPNPPKDFHPLKGPMTTQTLRGMKTHGPMHWRGDRSGANDTMVPSSAFDTEAGFKRFNPAFDGLVGKGSTLTDDQMQAFTDFILQVEPPPNPIRSLDNSLTPDELAGETFYFNDIVDTKTCNGCHVLDPPSGFFGTDGRMTFEGEPQYLKVAHLNNVYTKVGMFGMPVPQGGGSTHMGDQIRGFGLLHDGSVDTVLRFLNAPVFSFPGGDPQRQQVEAFVLAFDSKFAPIVGQQITLDGTNAATADPRIDLLLQRAAAGECDVVVKGIIAGEARGAHRLASGQFQTDRAGDALMNEPALRALASAGQELTYTAVPPGNGYRIGVDADGDGALDSDERDANTDPGSDLSLPMANLVCGTSNPLLDPMLRISRNDQAAGLQRLTLRGTVNAPFDSVVDPRANGLRFKIQDKDGNGLFYIAVGRGDPLVKNAPGWKVNAAKTRWTYKDRLGTVGGVRKIVVRRVPSSNIYKVSVRGTNGNYQVAGSALPLAVVSVLGGPEDGAAGRCGSLLFNPSGGSSPKCRLSSSGATVICN